MKTLKAGKFAVYFRTIRTCSFVLRSRHKILQKGTSFGASRILNFLVKGRFLLTSPESWLLKGTRTLTGTCRSNKLDIFHSTYINFKLFHPNAHFFLLFFLLGHAVLYTYYSVQIIHVCKLRSNGTYSSTIANHWW